MDKKISFKDQPTKVKILYGVTVAILCITAIVIGAVSAASKKEPLPEDTQNPPIQNGPGTDDGGGMAEKPKETVYYAPTNGTVVKSHSTDTPVFSNTLGEWRIHTGIDISTEDGAEVRAVADGTVTRVYNHPLHGKTVEIAHSGDVVSMYSNLAAETVAVKEGDVVTCGTKIGTVGDTSLTELADEPHLHFEMKLKGTSVNPLDYFTESSKEASLGIK